jgi:hypothetical protein
MNWQIQIATASSARASAAYVEIGADLASTDQPGRNQSASVLRRAAELHAGDANGHRAAKTLNDRRWSTDQWKVIFLEALGHELAFIPSLDGKFIPTGNRAATFPLRKCRS